MDADHVELLCFSENIWLEGPGSLCRPIILLQETEECSWNVGIFSSTVHRLLYILEIVFKVLSGLPEEKDEDHDDGDETCSSQNKTVPVDLELMDEF